MAATRQTLRIESVEDAVVEILKRNTTADCIAMMGDANETARILSAAGIRHLHSDWTEEQVHAEVARRMLG
jgi:hypothetical protein